jgi:SSS family solute:Na+ symporter
MIVAFGLVAGFVFVSGIRGVAWVSVIKDLLLLFAAVFVGISIPYIYFGGIGKMFAALALAKPAHLVMPGTTKNLGHIWYVSSLMMTSLGFFMWPQNFVAAYTARSGQILRRNAILMPLYSITMPLMIIVGLTAVLVIPNLTNGDLSLLTMVRKTFPAWFLGMIGGAGALTAMVPAASQLLTAATLFSKNLCRPIMAPEMSDRRVAMLARVMVFVLTASALVLAIRSSTTLVQLLLIGYAGVAQFLPGVLFGLYAKRPSTTAIFAGMMCGVAVVSFLTVTKRDPWMGWNAGFLGLCLNFAVAAGVSFVAKRAGSRQQAFPGLATGSGQA